MSHSITQSESTQAGYDDRAQTVAFLDFYHVQFAIPDNTNPIFEAYVGQLPMETTHRNSTPLDSYSELQKWNSASQLGM
ncbi:MAG: hypothetical protein OSA11_00780 [Candidatus Nanopelagicales bacterium]|nr:hypothetical protein [Candidatus Nanopelagicales bacterium]